VDRMERNGLVKRVRNTKDRRSFCLMMTKKGEKSLQAGLGSGSIVIQEVMSCLSNKELGDLIEFLEKVRTKAIDHCYTKKTMTEITVSDKSVA
jgi:DNA-binding MarR family transcriptional regulator